MKRAFWILFIAFIFNGTAHAIGITPSADGNYTLVYRATNFSIANNVDAAVNWDTNGHDPLGTHSLVVNPQLIVVPAGFHEARIFCQVFWSGNGTGQRTMYFYQNGSLLNLPTAEDTNFAPPAGAPVYQRLFSSWRNVTPGDTFSLQVNQNSGVALNVLGSSETWLQIEYR